MARKRRQRRDVSAVRRALKRVGQVMLLFVLLSLALVLPLRWYNPSTSMFMLQDESGREPLLHEWVTWEQFGRAMPLAVVAAEDQRFADHFGIDVVAIRKSIDEQDERGYLRGGSTITQQTVKNLFLWSGRSFVRKGLEAWLTIVAESCMPKRRILEIYLNVVELGTGIYGAAAASRYYFGKSPSQLSDREAALLAAVLPSPRRYSVADPSDFVREQRDWILGQLQRLEREGWITRIDHAGARPAGE